jgi:hypothetical protein
LFELSHSKNEIIQLQAIRELLDRMLGKPAVVVDTTHTPLDLGAMYLRALQAANQPREPSHVLPRIESKAEPNDVNASATTTY